MNTYAVVMSPNSGTGAIAAGSAASHSSGKQGAANTFAGTLLHVMGGSAAANTTTIQGNGIFAGLQGLAGLFENEADPDISSMEILNLIHSLVEQSGNLEDTEQLPADLQSGLGALLQLVQNLLKSSEPMSTAAPAEQLYSETVLRQAAADPKAGQTITAQLQQALQNLADKITLNEVNPAQSASLTEPLAQALTALQSYAGQKTRASASAMGATAAAENSKATPAFQMAQAIVPETGQAAVQTEVRVHTRPSMMPLHSQVWTHGGTAAAADTETAVSAALASATAAEPAEGLATSTPAPVWTFLKGSQQAVPGTGLGNAQTQTPQSIPVQQFAQEMEKFLVKQFILTQGNGVSEARISLHPEHLGQLNIKIVIQNGLLTAQFAAESGMAREMLEAQMAQLRSALQGQGLQVERMEVVQQQPSQTSASFMGSHQGKQGTGHNGGGAKNGNRGGYEDSAAFEAELDRTAFLREIGYGSALNVTA